MADGGEVPVDAVPSDGTDNSNPAKIFVGQIPRVLQETDIEAMFQTFGPIKEVSILRGQGGVSKGCAFVTLSSVELAQQAIAALHHSTTFDGCRSAMVVKFADNHETTVKLFVGQIPRGFTEDNMKELFAPFGKCTEVSILRHPDGVSKGCGFVTMDSKVKAQQAISALDHSKTFEGCRSALVVRFADTDKDKLQKKMQTQIGGGNPMMYGLPHQLLMQQQHMMGMGGMGGMGGMNQFGGAGAGMQGGMQGGMPPMAGLMGMQNPAAQGGQGGFGMDQQAQALQQFYAAGFAQQPYGQQAGGPVPQQQQGAGPDGANLFIYHLPKELDDAALATTFMPFGNVISAKVFTDPKTGESKCFGFVSYDNPVSAQHAIQSMDGMQIGPKRIKVSLKRAKGMQAPQGGNKFQPY